MNERLLLCIFVASGLAVRTNAAAFDICPSDLDLPEFVNSLCYHRNRLWAAGSFNRAGSASALNLAYFDVETSKWQAPLLVGPNVTFEFYLDNQDADQLWFVGNVQALVCEEEDDYIYVGGVFKLAAAVNGTTAAYDGGGEENELGADDYTVVNNFARFNVVDNTVEGLAVDEDVGFTNSNSNGSFVAAIECVPSTGCTEMYVGGYFDSVVGVAASSIVHLDITDWYRPIATPLLGSGAGNYSESATVAGSWQSNDGNGVDGFVTAIAYVNKHHIVFGGTFLTAGSSSSFMIAQYSEVRCHTRESTFTKTLSLSLSHTRTTKSRCLSHTHPKLSTSSSSGERCDWVRPARPQRRVHGAISLLRRLTRSCAVHACCQQRNAFNRRRVR
jgi:hypothetical protein